MAARTTPGAAVPPPPHLSVEDRLRQLEERIEELTASKPWFASLPGWFLNLFSGVTIIVLIGFGYWLGGMNTALAQNTDKVNKVYDVLLESKDSVTTRLNAIELQLAAIDKKLSDRESVLTMKKNQTGH